MQYFSQFAEFLQDFCLEPFALLFEKQESDFSSHRHDQSILSIIVRYYEDKINILVKDELSESDYPDQILKASRRLDHVPENKLKSQLKKLYYRIKK